MKISPTLFKAYDVRGLVGVELTNEVAEGIGRAFADFLPTQGPVCVGYDMRPDSVELAANVRAGLVKQGRVVYDIGEVTSDMIYFAVGFLKAAGGAMVTASHNPGQYNGVKLCREEARGVSLETGLEKVRDAIAADSYKVSDFQGSVESKDIMDAWIDHALGFVDISKMKPYHIAIDAGNGMSGKVMPHIGDKWPVRFEPMYFELDGTFPNHPANPLIEENLRDLAARVSHDRLDFGLAFDGDGDRAVFVDEEGQPVSQSIITAILADYFLKRNPGATILYNANVSRIVPETVAAAGGKSFRTRIGHSYVKQAMREHDAVFAGEHSGHYYFRDNWSADAGLIAAVCAIAALSESGLKLSELAAKYHKYFASGEQNFEIADKLGKMYELKDIYSSGEQDELDGLTVSFPEWWFIVRASNTEPYLRLNVEATSPELLHEKLAELRDIMAR